MGVECFSTTSELTARIDNECFSKISESTARYNLSPAYKIHTSKWIGGWTVAMTFLFNAVQKASSQENDKNEHSLIWKNLRSFISVAIYNIQLTNVCRDYYR